MSYQFITHSEEQGREWEYLVGSDPERVISTLSLGPLKRRNRWGDTQGDIFPAMAAVAKAARENNAQWHRLVEGGIANRLCQNVLDMCTFVHSLPTMPEDLKRKAMDEIPSPYFLPLEVLCNAVLTMSRPPNSTDLQLVKVLKKRWHEMMERLWDEPENTLKKGLAHVRERMVVPQVVIPVASADPSFLSVIDADTDVTISLITRYFMHATEVADLTTSAQGLIELFDSRYPLISAYRKVNPVPRNFLDRMIRGAGSYEKLLAKCISHLSNASFEGVIPLLAFITELYSLIKAQKPELVQKFRRSSPLWTNLFLQLRKAAKNAPPELNKPYPGDRLFLPIIGLVAGCLHDCERDEPDELEPLLVLLIRTDFFSALDQALTRCATQRGITMQVARIYNCIDVLVKDRPSAVEAMRNELPRPRALRALLENAFTPDGNPRMPSLPGLAPGQVPVDSRGWPLTDTLWDQGAWEYLHKLQETCMDESICTRRTCKKPAKESCEKCKLAPYCGPDCQTKDLKEHRLVCGFKVHRPDVPGPVTITLPAA